MKPDSIQINKREKQLLSDFEFCIKGTEFVIPSGYIWDGATAGGWFTRLMVGLNRFGDMDEATLKHDYIYFWEGDIGPLKITRKEADQEFKKDLQKIRFKGLRLFLIYRFVRFFGVFYWVQI